MLQLISNKFHADYLTKTWTIYFFIMIIYIFQHDRRKRKKIKIQQVFVVGHRKLELASDRLIRRQRGYMAKSVKEPKQHLNDFIYIRCKFCELD